MSTSASTSGGGSGGGASKAGKLKPWVRAQLKRLNGFEDDGQISDYVLSLSSSAELCRYLRFIALSTIQESWLNCDLTESLLILLLVILTAISSESRWPHSRLRSPSSTSCARTWACLVRGLSIPRRARSRRERGRHPDLASRRKSPLSMALLPV